jgi:hypothetical protein
MWYDFWKHTNRQTVLEHWKWMEKCAQKSDKHKYKYK